MIFAGLQFTHFKEVKLLNETCQVMKHAKAVV